MTSRHFITPVQSMLIKNFYEIRSKQNRKQIKSKEFKHLLMSLSGKSTLFQRKSSANSVKENRFARNENVKSSPNDVSLPQPDNKIIKQFVQIKV